MYTMLYRKKTSGKRTRFCSVFSLSLFVKIWDISELNGGPFCPKVMMDDMVFSCERFETSVVVECGPLLLETYSFLKDTFYSLRSEKCEFSPQAQACLVDISKNTNLDNALIHFSYCFFHY